MKKILLTMQHRAAPELAPECGGREKALADLREGKLDRLRFSANVWSDGKNKNHYYFKPEELESFARSFTGQPFLMDHERETAKRGGTIIDSQLVKTEAGRNVIRQTIEVVKPWAKEGVLDGTIDRFSIGWDAEGHDCTVCQTDIVECKHGPWEIGRRDKETGDTVGVLWTGLEGVETSSVTHPAAEGTGDVLAHLAKLRTHASGIPPGGLTVAEVQMLERIKKLLGLPADTAEPEALTALEARLSQKPGLPKAMFTALGLPEDAPEDQVIAKAVSLSAPGNFVARADHDTVVAELAAIRAGEAVRKAKEAGKITPAMEGWAKEFAARDLKSFEAYLAHAPAQIPFAAEMPKIDAPKTGAGVPTDEERMMARRFGLSIDQYLKDKKAAADYEARVQAN